MLKVPMTPKGYQSLADELKHLKAVDRPAVIRAIAAAREHGDLSENAEYHAAREHQGFIEGRIVDLEDKTARAEIIDVKQLSGDTIKFGATITLIDEETNETITYQIVGADESDIRKGLLSVQSPLARALISKSAGETCEVRTPGGIKSYEITHIAFI